jgi:hypothetical protein
MDKKFFSCLLLLAMFPLLFAGCNFSFSATTVKTLEFPAADQTKQITFDAKHSRRANLQQDLEKTMDELDTRNESYSIKLLCDGPDPKGKYSVIVDRSYYNKDNVVYSARTEIDDKYYIVKRGAGVKPQKGRENRDKFIVDLIEHLEKIDISKK